MVHLVMCSFPFASTGGTFGRQTRDSGKISDVFISMLDLQNSDDVSSFTGIYSLQVACGAYHSLALVRSLPPQDYTTHNSPKKKEQGQSPHCSVTEREELPAVEDAHYCPLGVELTEVMKGEVNKNTNMKKMVHLE